MVGNYFIMINKFTSILTLIFAMILLSSCINNDLKEYYGKESALTMRPAYLGEMPQGDDSYSKGVRDGCNTSIAVVGTGPMAEQYDDIYYDFDKTNDQDYYRGRTLGFNYCTYYQDPDPL